MCCSTAKWKREEVPDHKFDFIDVKDFYDGAFIRRFTYLFLFAIIIKNILVYTADLWTVYLLFTSVKWADNIKSQKVIDLQVSRWIFFASIVCSFLLLLWELRKTIRVVKSRDIAYAYTCTGAYRFYSVRSYPHYCLFSQINNSRKKTDRVAFFVYFTLKGWKRFLLAEAPRQIVNGIALFNVYVTNGKFNIKQFYENGDTIMANIMFGLMTFTFCVWAISALLLVFAAILYVPLLCQIRGNLKEYVCHKIDKRLALLLRNKSRKRILEERREQLRLAQEMQALPGANTTALLPMREPTLPQMGLLNANQKRPMQPQQQHQSQQHQQHSQNAVMSLPGDKGPHPAVYSNNPSNQPHPPSSSNYAHAHPPSSASYHHISQQQQQQQQQPYPMSANSPHPYSGNSNQPSYDNASAHHHGGRRRADSTVSSNSGYSQPRTGGPVMDGGNGIRPPVPPVPLQHMTTSHSYSASVTSGHGARGPASSSSSHYPYDKETTAFTMPPLPPPPPRSEADIRDDISESSYAYSNTGRPAVEEYNTRPLPRPLPLHQQQQQQQQQPASSSHSSRPPHSSTSNQSAKSPTQSSFAGEHRDPHRYPFKNIYDHPPRDTPDSPMSTVNPSRLPPPPISTSSTALQHPRQPSNEGHRYGGTSNNGGVTMTSSHSATSNSAAYYKPSEDRYHQSPTRTRVEDTNNNSNNNHDMNNDDHDDGEPTFNRYNDRGRYAARHYNQHHQPQQQQQQQQQHQHHQNSSSHSNQIRRPGNSQGSQHGSRNHGGGAGGPVYF